MKNRSSAWCKGLVLPCVVAILLVIVPSCRRSNPTVSSHDARYAQLDSMIGQIHDLDSLESLVRQSHDQNDAVGEMLALKHHGVQLHNQALYPQAIKVHTAGLEIATSLVDTIETLDPVTAAFAD